MLLLGGTEDLDSMRKKDKENRISNRRVYGISSAVFSQNPLGSTFKSHSWGAKHLLNDLAKSMDGNPWIFVT